MVLSWYCTSLPALTYFLKDRLIWFSACVLRCRAQASSCRVWGWSKGSAQSVRVWYERSGKSENCERRTIWFAGLTSPPNILVFWTARSVSEDMTWARPRCDLQLTLLYLRMRYRVSWVHTNNFCLPLFNKWCLNLFSSCFGSFVSIYKVNQPMASRRTGLPLKSYFIFFPIQRQMWEMEGSIEISFFFDKKMNLLWILEVYYPIGPKEAPTDYPQNHQKV